ncbi:MAG: sulfotransferase family 2 domain-containing protein [Candidatus Caenarcaniphilales bacterium]|nr:sulfotransferase family 2 domain-containing protein [Candidatus Caenarcaniphilales bacterium]
MRNSKASSIQKVILSHKHRFVFIHIYKVAGTSLTKALLPYGKELRNPLLVRLIEKFTGKCHTQNLAHLSAVEVRALLKPNEFREYFKFAFVRNPFDWIVSYYEYIRQNPFHYRHELVKEMDFGKFVQWRHEHEFIDKRHQKDFVVDEKGVQLVDFIGRYERLEEDFREICERIEVSAELPSLNHSHRKDLGVYYRDESIIKLTREHLAPDFAFFDYKPEICGLDLAKPLSHQSNTPSKSVC